MSGFFKAVHPELRKPSRQRHFKSCEPCRQKKTKCNAESPCEACTKRRKPDDCTYDTDTTTQFEEKPGLTNCLMRLEEPVLQCRMSAASAQQEAFTPRNTADVEYQFQIADILTLNIVDIVRTTLPVFFGCGDPVTSMLHQEILLNEWENFTSCPQTWSQVDGMSLMALIFGCSALAISHLALLDKDFPDHLGTASQPLETFIDKCYRCFHHFDLETPGQYKVVAAIIRIAVLVYCKHDLKRGFAALAQAIGLAQSSGYANPRDPSLDDVGLSEMQIEYCKRAWENLQSFKYHVSFYCNQIQTIRPESKVEALTNLLESDMPMGRYAELPPPRPLTQITPVLPLILKRELQRVSTEIGLAIFCKERIALKEIDKFDIMLDAAYRQVSTTALGGTVLQALRLNHALSTIYHSAKIVLHRWSLLAENADDQSPHVGKSRSQCVGSAVEVLKIQKALLENRRSQEDRWELDPLIVYDFLLAATIICLELSNSTRCVRSTTSEEAITVAPPSELSFWLRSSIEFWQEAGSCWSPQEARRLCSLFCGVLQRSHPACTQADATFYFPAENPFCSSPGFDAVTSSFYGDNHDFSVPAVAWNLSSSGNIWDDLGNEIIESYSEWMPPPHQQG